MNSCDELAAMNWLRSSQQADAEEAIATSNARVANLEEKVATLTVLLEKTGGEHGECQPLVDESLSSEISSRVLWQWSMDDGTFVNYDAINQLLLEACYQQEVLVAQIDSDEGSATVNLQLMMQNQSGSRLQCRVRRLDLDGAPIGERWIHQDDPSIMCLVQPGESDFALVESVFYDRQPQGTITREDFGIVQVRRLQVLFVLTCEIEY